MVEFYRGIWVVAYRELLRFVQERSRMISSFAFPLMFLVVFGAGFNRIVGTMTEGVDFIKFMYPGILSMTVVMSSMFSGMSIVWDREFGFLKEILVAPISRTGIVIGKALGGSATAMAQGIILLILAPFLGISLTFLLVIKYLLLVLLLFSWFENGHFLCFFSNFLENNRGAVACICTRELSYAFASFIGN